VSHFVQCQTEFRDAEALIAALVECGFEPSQTEGHAEAAPLFGYQGDVRPQKAHVVIRRQHVGSGANDVGWERQPNGTFKAWIGEFDGRHRFDEPVQNRIKQDCPGQPRLAGPARGPPFSPVERQSREAQEAM